MTTPTGTEAGDLDHMPYLPRYGLQWTLAAGHEMKPLDSGEFVKLSDVKTALARRAAPATSPHAAPDSAALPLDLDELSEIEAIALAAPKVWYGTYQIVDGISDEKAVALIEACSPDTICTLVAQARAAQPDTTASASDHDNTFVGGSIFKLSGWAGGAAPGGAFSTVTCEYHKPDGTVEVIDYVRAAQPVQAGEAVDERALLKNLADAADTFLRGGVAPLRALIDKARASLAPVSAQQGAAVAVPPKREPRNDDPREQAHAAGFNVCRELWLAAKAPAAQAVTARPDFCSPNCFWGDCPPCVETAPEAMTSEQQPATQQDARGAK